MRSFCILIASFLLLSCSSNQSNKGQQDEAELPSDDFDVLTALMIANKQYEKDNFEQASKGFDIVIRLDSMVGEAHYKLVYSLGQLGDKSTLVSVEHYIKAAELKYRPTDAYYNAGIYMSIFHSDSVAIELFKKSLELNPDQSEILDEIKQAKERLSSKYGIKQI
ncbi:MAG: Tfp pilus assembly protein PilF [Cyclobacteriaceae bacterium]|jgi:Tfp pilus assembly protein PilF